MKKRKKKDNQGHTSISIPLELAERLDRIQKANPDLWTSRADLAQKILTEWIREEMGCKQV